ncbi:hypothetical protein [Streptomyces sp. NPDC057257]|uniref:hypothetical protein n=1 Tax=Streptomyces sp. NPDC057257 TaxID=3346071 RepID=UPI0036307EFD
MLIAVLCLTALAPGVATAWLLRARGPLIATLAGAAVTAALPFLLLVSLIVFPPLGLVVAILAVIAALTAYDRGRLWAATAWTGIALVASAYAGWPR